RPHHRDDQWNVQLSQLRQVVLEESIEALVRQPDRVDQPGWRLPQARRRVAGARLRSDRLGDEGREGELVDERVPEGSPGSDRVERSRPVDDGVAQLDAAEIHRQCPDPGTRAVSISSPRTTGPSTQSRIYPPVACGIAQPKQAPKPQ